MKEVESITSENQMSNYYFTYLVVFKSSQAKFNGPILFSSEKNNGTMHLFDEDLYSTLDSLEFIMHLPRNIFDLCNMDADLMAHSYDIQHLIVIIPESLISQSYKLDATMIMLADDCSENTEQICKASKPLLGVYHSRDASDDLLKSLWRDLVQHNKAAVEEYSVVPNIETQHLLKGELIKSLPTLFLSRQLGKVDDFFQKIYNCANIEQEIIELHWNYMSIVNTYLALEEKGIYELDDNNFHIFDKELEIEFKKLQINVIITFPGIPKRQKELGMNASTLSDVERRIIRIIGTHRAIARYGLLIELPCASETLFQKYDRLEECCKNGTNNRFVWRSLKDLGKQLNMCFKREQTCVLKRAKDITVFSDFPIGITILKNDEVPLQCYKSISYLPLTPLTICLQREMIKKNQMYFGNHCKIAIAECVPNDEESKLVYRYSSTVLWAIENMQKTYPNFSATVEHIDSIASMRRFIKRNSNVDILYISAHGSYDRSKNMAGIIVGEEFWMADEDLKTPPIVILSACHTAPRGFGCITIADMFLRKGALAVLGTFIPINAHRNLILMTRLFTYIAEAQHKNSQYKTLADAWSGIVASNAIHELMLGSKRFQKWMHENGKNGISRIKDFQLNRCVNRLRITNVYSDTIKIIKEMLAEENMQGKFDNILSQNDFFPESFFYQFLGSPENVFLYNETFDEYNKRFGTDL